jgi:hypothetical protein
MDMVHCVGVGFTIDTADWRLMCNGRYPESINHLWFTFRHYHRSYLQFKAHCFFALYQDLAAFTARSTTSIIQTSCLEFQNYIIVTIIVVILGHGLSL